MAHNLLERSVAGLDVEHVDDNEFDGEPDAVDDVVLPADVADGDGVNVLVEEDCVIPTLVLKVVNLRQVVRRETHAKDQCTGIQPSCP